MVLKKLVNKFTFDKLQISDCIGGSFVYGRGQAILFTFALDKPPVLYCEPEKIHQKISTSKKNFLLRKWE